MHASADHDQRLAFADLLDRVLAGTSNLEDWADFVMTHYDDEQLEQIRNECVRLAAIEPNFWTLVQNHSSQLSAWARVLRGGSS